MKKRFCLLLIVLFLPVFTNFVNASEINTSDTKFLSQPAISSSSIAFVYAGDLWITDHNGQNVKRLTSDVGNESDPVMSKDGKLVAFSAQYDGNTDVYIIPAEGGIPKRLTWHPGNDRVRGFTPDGKSILFASSRFSFTGRYNQLYTVPVDGGNPVRLKIPNAFRAVYSPDGKKMAYTPLAEVYLQWKNYRGGTHTEIWIFTLSDNSVVKIPQPDGGCNDTSPMWMGDKVYFRSDRNGEFNLYSYNVNSKEIDQLTQFDDFPVLSATGIDGKIAYEQAGHIHILNTDNSRSTRMKIGIAADLNELRSRYIKGNNYIRSSSISPSGARAVFGFRGEIVTVPAKKGDPRNLTNSAGVHEKFPEWSPDGKSIAYFSDESGEYEIHISPQEGKGEIKKFKLDGSGFYTFAQWSPDSKKITFVDNSRTLYWLDVETGKITKIVSEHHLEPGAFGSIRGRWSPDSKWIVYTVNTQAWIQMVKVYSIEEKKSYPVTDGLSEVSEPVFDKSGKYMYFFASTDAGPVKHWFAMSNADMQMSNAIYLVTLKKDYESPLAKESDEEKVEEVKETPEEDTETKEEFSIDFDGLESRVINIPVGSGNYSNLQAGDEGQIYYLEAPPNSGPFAAGTKLHKYDVTKRKDEVLIESANNYRLSSDKKKILYGTRGTYFIAGTGSKPAPGSGKLGTESIEVKIDPVSEWKQIFNEAWRINRDYFYATNMHGADWNAMKRKYESFLPHLPTRNDLNRLIRWMCSELSVGHHGVGGGDFLNQPKRVGGGLLGADYVTENGKYRFNKIYGGLNWNPQLRSPLTEPGVNINEGDYLLSVNGKELDASMNIFSLFENTSGKIVELKISTNSDASNSQIVKVVPVGNEAALRNRDWVEGNIKKVNEATNGRVAYVYVPNTTGMGHTYFKRYFFPQVHKDAIIIDERFNGGGQVADYYIDLLRRPFTSYWNLRYGADIKTPSASIDGPKVMITDETAGSGGDLLPWMFRKFNVGKIVGKRTWGGLVGTLGFPRLMDGGRVTAPNLAIWTPEGGWVVENVGVPPDIEVEQWPSEVISGRDPQLEKAIEVALEELRKNPPKRPQRPPYPVRVKKK